MAQQKVIKTLLEWERAGQIKLIPQPEINGRICYQIEVYQTTKKVSRAEWLLLFASAYHVYPKKTAYGDAEKQWMKMKASRDLYDEIMKAIHLQSCAGGPLAADPLEGYKYVKSFSRWLEGRCWMDELEDPAMAASCNDAIDSLTRDVSEEEADSLLSTLNDPEKET